MLGIVIASVIALVVGFAIGYMVHDMRKMHRGGKSLTDAPGDVGGVSPGGVTFFGSTGSH